MFSDDPLLRQGAVVLLVRGTQLATFRLLFRDTHFEMKFLPALVALIPKSFTLGMELDFTATQQLEVVPPPFLVSGTNNLLSVQIHDQLNLDRMPLLLATVKSLLIPLGALNRRFSHIHREVWGGSGFVSRCFFPGSLNLPERIKVVSTRCTVRQRVDSATPQS